MKRLPVATALALAMLVLSGVVWAAFASRAAGAATARSEQMPEGGRPSVERTGRDVRVRWPAASFSNGTESDSYLIRRYDAEGQESTVGEGCEGERQGLECTEEAVPPGEWLYTVTPRFRGWTGTESETSDVILVPGASLTLVPYAVTALPATLEGEIDVFPEHEIIEFRLDAADGPTLTGTVEGLPTPAIVPDGGRGSVTVTLPAGTAEGEHRVFAVASPSHEEASALLLVDTITPVLTALEMRDIDANGWVDRVTAAFSENLAPYSAGTSPWTVANVPSGGSLAGVSVQGRVAELILAEGPGEPDTSVGELTVALEAYPTGIRDAAGNEASFASTPPIDRAGPVVVTLADLNNPVATDGKMEPGDALKLSFSEDIAETFPLLSTASLADAPGDANDTLRIAGVTDGAVDTGSDGYVTRELSEARFPALQLELGMTANVLRIVVLAPCDPPLGEDACSEVLAAGGPGALAFRPSPSLHDAAGNPAAGTFRTDPGFRLF